MQGTSSNKDGIGAKIELTANGTKQYYYTLCGEGYLGQNTQTKIIGIGDASLIDEVKVTWLNGSIDVINDLLPNQTITLIEGENALYTADSEFIDFIIYPNPSKGIYRVGGLENFDHDTEVQLFNALGCKVNFDNLIKNGELDITKLNEGIYYLKVHSTRGVITKKLIYN